MSKFLFILLVGLIICTGTLLYESYHEVDLLTYSKLELIFHSSYLHDSIITGIAISFPMLVELIYDSVSQGKYVSKADFFARAIVLLFLFIPNVAVVVFIFPMGGPSALAYLIFTSSMIYVNATFFYLYYYSTTIWNNNLTPILSLFYTLATSLTYFKLLYPNTYLSSIISVLYTLVTILVINKTIYWLLNIRKMRKQRILTFHEQCCNIYIAAIFSIGIFSWIFYVVKINGPDLTFSYPNYILSFYAILINIIHGRQAKQDSKLTQQALDIKRMFVRFVSHEIRTPLNTVFLGLKVLKQEITEMPLWSQAMTVNQTLEDIETSCNNSLEILNDLLLYDKIDSGIQGLDRMDVNLREVIGETIQSFEIQARVSEISLSFVDASWSFPIANNALDQSGGSSSSSSSSSSPLMCILDPFKIKQVVRNLLSNALTFTPPGGRVTVTLSLQDTPDLQLQLQDTPILHSTNFLRRFNAFKVHCNDANKNTNPGATRSRVIVITVQDTGHGISYENQEKLFKNIIQFSPGILQSGQGTGLGLYISHGIMKLHGGNLTVTSAGLGSGSTFTATFPFLSLRSRTRSTDEGHVPNPGPRIDGTAAATPTNLVATPQLQEALEGCNSNRNRTHSKYYSHNDVTNKDTAKGPCDNNLDNNDNSASSSADNFSHLMDVPMHLSIAKSSRYSSSDGVTHITGTSRSTGTLTTAVRKHRVTDFLASQNVLVVDDAPLNRKMLSRLLVSRCRAVHEAEDGEAAVLAYKQSVLREEEMDVILMDYQMPKLDGPSAASALRGLGFTGLIIGVTGNAVQNDIDTFMNRGANFVMAKPLNFDVLEEKLCTYIEHE